MRSERFKKIFCLLILFCLGLKNVSFAVQPFGQDESIATAVSSKDNDPSLLELVAGFVDLDLGGEGKDLFYYRVDKQRPAGQQFRFTQVMERSQCETVFTNNEIRVQQRFKGTDRKFSLPPHHHFLFRLTPF